MDVPGRLASEVEELVIRSSMDEGGKEIQSICALELLLVWGDRYLDRLGYRLNTDDRKERSGLRFRRRLSRYQNKSALSHPPSFSLFWSPSPRALSDGYGANRLLKIIMKNTYTGKIMG